MKINVIKNLNKLKSNKLLISIAVAFAVMFNISTYSVFAKYSSEFINSISFQIEKPILEVSSDAEQEITITSNTAKYSFNVKNYNNEEQINNIDMKYYLEIVSDKLDMLKIHLYKGEEELKLEKYKTEEFKLKKSEKQLDEYHLEVILLDDANQNIDSSIQIKINCVQVDS